MIFLTEYRYMERGSLCPRCHTTHCEIYAYMYVYTYVNKDTFYFSPSSASTFSLVRRGAHTSSRTLLPVALYC